MRVALLVLITCVVGCSFVKTPTPPAPDRRTSLGIDISQLELANGLRVILVEDSRATEVQVTMRYRVGAADDPDSQEGMAHLVEHLMFQQVLGAQSLFARLQDTATFFNASTSYDATTYVSRGQPAQLEELLSVEAVRLGFRCTTITDAVFARERDVVINELRQRDAGLELRRALHAGVYPDAHPYRRAGTDATVNAITRDQACAFADAHYAPVNAVLVVSGNITKPRVSAALGKFLAKIPKRTAAVQPAVLRISEPATRAVEAPLDEEAILVAWPLPQNLNARAGVRAIAKRLTQAVDAAVKGHVIDLELGDERAKLIALVIAKHRSESIGTLLDKVERAIDHVPDSFTDRTVIQLTNIMFDILKQGAIHDVFAGFEDGSDRDTRLATYALAGRDPVAAIGSEIDALRNLNSDNAADLAKKYLVFHAATVVTLKPRTGAKHGAELTLVAGTHDLGQRREPPDPALAQRPLATTPPTTRPTGGDLQTRTLPNGLGVVMLPLSSAPTVDMRIVFRAGTAEDPAGKSGAALVAGQTLTFDMRYFDDLLRFAAAGGTTTVDVGVDHTAFIARGIDMHLDYLLAGLRRLVREGRHDDPSSYVTLARRQAKHADTNGTFTDAWRAALYGDTHPYVRTGLRHTSAALSLDDISAFRARYYTPDNATLVISGRFDPVLADRWIAFLFADWKGKAGTRESPRAVTRPQSLAKDEALAQVHVRIAIPAAGSRAQQLVAAAMLAEIAGDVRHQLGASYGFSADLEESRLATTFVLEGWVDAPRAHEAIALLRTRLAALRDSDTAARAFVIARARVSTQLAALVGSASNLSDRAQRDLVIGRRPLSDLQTAREVQRLTIATMGPVLQGLDLATAAISMRGPAAEIDRAYTVLGRTARYIPSDRLAADPELPVAAARPPPLDFAELLGPLTDQGAPPGRWVLAVQPGVSFGRVRLRDVRGYTVAGQIAYRRDHRTSIGVHASVGQLEGEYGATPTSPGMPISVIPLHFSAFFQGLVWDHAWFAVNAGLYFHSGQDNGFGLGVAPAFGVGTEAGVFALRIGKHRLGAFAHFDTELGGSIDYTGLTFGVTYRQFERR